METGTRRRRALLFLMGLIDRGETDKDIFWHKKQAVRKKKPTKGKKNGHFFKNVHRESPKSTMRRQNDPRIFI